IQEPTLHVKPGDTLNITVTNNTPKQPYGETFIAPNCGDATVQYTPPPSGITSTGSSVNLHYHGTNVTPQCSRHHVTRTVITSPPPSQYCLTFPPVGPARLYAYHPHAHRLAERDLLGGASGALVVDGIENVQPAVAGLRQQLIVSRDQPQVQGLPEGPGNC